MSALFGLPRIATTAVRKERGWGHGRNRIMSCINHTLVKSFSHHSTLVRPKNCNILTSGSTRLHASFNGLSILRNKRLASLTNNISQKRFSISKVKLDLLNSEDLNHNQTDKVVPPSNSAKVSSSHNVDIEAEIESVVRQAQETFGNTLPKDYLSKEEYVVYERLFGPPLRETSLDDLEILPSNDFDPLQENQVVLLEKNIDGKFEKVDYDPRNDHFITESQHFDNSTNSELYEQHVPAIESEEISSYLTKVTDPQIKHIARNQRQERILIQLQRDKIKEIIEFKKQSYMKDEEKLNEVENVAKENLDEEEQEYQDEEDQEYQDEDNLDPYTSSDTSRIHPHTIAGRSRSNPSTIHLSNRNFVAPITELLSRTKSSHLQLAAEKAFGGKGIPFSASVPSSMKYMPQNKIGLDASQHRMSEIEADAYMSAVMPGAYASIMSTLIEVRKRLGQEWLRELILRKDGDGPTVLDAGSGGAGVIAWREVMEAERSVMKDEGVLKGELTPIGKSSVVVGSDSLRHRASKLLENTTFLPRLPDYLHTTQNEGNIDEGLGPKYRTGRKTFDIVIAPYILQSQKENYKRKNIVKNLWTLVNPNGGVLIILEKGLPRGFEAVAGARSFILDHYIASPGSSFVENEINSPESEKGRFTEKEEGMIIAPCTNHMTCPMYLTPGISGGRKDFCYFPQRFIRPPFLQKLLDAKVRNHEDAKFSYIAFRRGVDARKASSDLLIGHEATTQSFKGYEEEDLPESHQEENYIKSNVKFNTLSLPRIILPPLKRHGHVIIDVCTPSAQLERWVVPKSFSQVAYHDARKSKWGDLWALGGKTRVPKNVRLGKVIGSNGKERNDTSVKKKVAKYDMIIGKNGLERIQRAGRVYSDRNKKRTKGGRLSKGPEPIGEDDL